MTNRGKGGRPSRKKEGEGEKGQRLKTKDQNPRTRRNNETRTQKVTVNLT
jgi:hypothetical protein